MKPNIAPKVDGAFKAMLGSEEHKTLGFLKASFRLADAMCAMRSIHRHRDTLNF